MTNHSFNKWKIRLTTGWNFMRFLKLSLAVIAGIEAWRNADVLFGILSFILLMQTIYNVSCCGAAGCDTNYSDSPAGSGKQDDSKITFEEFK